MPLFRLPLLLSAFFTAFSFTFGQEDAVLDRIRFLEKNVDPTTDFPISANGANKGYHTNLPRGAAVLPTRMAFDFALALIASPNRKHQTRGAAVLNRIIDAQDTNPKSPTFGIWSWYYNEPLNQMAIPDYNWADFNGAVLALILKEYSERLPPELLLKTKQCLENCCRSIVKRNVGPEYTNIAIFGACVTAAAGELLDNKDFLHYGRKRMKRNVEHFRSLHRNFNEYNSPTYTMVVIRAIEQLLFLVKDKETRQAAEELFDGAWQTIAEHYHPPTGQWAGPFSRTYSDTISDTFRQELLSAAKGIPDARPSAQLLIPCLPCPEKYRNAFNDSATATPIERQHLFVYHSFPREKKGTTWMDDDATLGTVSFQSFWEQERGLIAYWIVSENDHSVAVLRTRFLHNGKDFTSGAAWNVQTGNRVLTSFGLLKGAGSMHPHFDRPADKKNTFVAKSFKIVCQLTAPEASIKQLESRSGEQCFELAAGKRKAVLHIPDGATFTRQPIRWATEQSQETVSLVGTCYEGGEKAFSFDTMDGIKAAMGIEIIKKDDKASNRAVKFVPRSRRTPSGEEYFGVEWSIGRDVLELTIPKRAILR